MLFGGSRSAEAPPPAEVQAAPVNESQWQSQAPAGQCSTEAKGELVAGFAVRDFFLSRSDVIHRPSLLLDFTKCMDATNDFPSCSYYLGKVQP
jgi:hypothetical protein